MPRTIEQANSVLESKGLSHFLQAIDVQEYSMTLRDIDYGNYVVDIKALCPKTSVSLHKIRRHKNKVKAIRDKFLGKKLPGAVVTDIFYGPDRGYKNRSFYFEYTADCGHSGISTYAYLTRHKKTFSCHVCSMTQHGARAKEEGKLKKRTSTYVFWQTKKKNFPKQFQEFETFRDAVGDKPFTRATIEFIEGVPRWVNLQMVEDIELNLMATALRQAFRHSTLYKAALKKAAVETDEGTRYRCAICLELFTQNKVQVDHIRPIADIDGSPLQKADLIDRIFTDKIQILDKKCHTKKSTQENILRRKHKKEKKANER